MSHDFHSSNSIILLLVTPGFCSPNSLVTEHSLDIKGQCLALIQLFSIDHLEFVIYYFDPISTSCFCPSLSHLNYHVPLSPVILLTPNMQGIQLGTP